MIKTLLLITACSFTLLSVGQNSFKAVVIDGKTRDPLIGASVVVKGTATGGRTGQDGFVQINNVPDGKQVVVFSYVGYKEKADTIRFPFTQTEPYKVYLVNDEEVIDEVFVTATRSRRTIEDIPTRIEAITGEELEEKGNMKPGDIRMMLNESTGIQMQQISATSNNSSIRIQGLDGRYTQMLRDGYPLYSGFSGGLGLLQIVPLDLEQVEVIKGASSTLYGGGAIAGLVNLVSKTPGDEREINFLLNVTSALGLDLSGFYSQKFKKIGLTLFTSYNSGRPYDPADIGLTAIPEFNRITFNPKLFVYFNPRTTFQIGFNSTIEDRIGGDILYIKGKGDSIHSYFEKNKTNRYSTQIGFSHLTSSGAEIKIKNSISYYDRKIEIPGFGFSGLQTSSFTEGSYGATHDSHEWIFGFNLWTDQFRQDGNDTMKKVNYSHLTFGAFVQNTWNVSPLITLEAGLRSDFQNEFGLFILPRLSALFRFNSRFSARLGGGLGYKIPTVFTEDAERLQFRNVLPVDVSKTKPERSVGSNLDVNYRVTIGNELIFNINSLFFYTRILHPLFLTETGNGLYEFVQPNGSTDTRGIETNIKFSLDKIKLFIGYTLTDVNQRINGNSSQFPLVARHRLNNILLYEIEERLKIGIEAYYYSRQKLNDGSTGRSYWLCGMMAEKLWKRFSVFINFENILDTRQTNFDTIFTGSVTNPVFRDIYAPVDGFVINGGIKIRL
jgi:outer membrane receptor for ferrienterochelin and colicins